MSEQPAAPAPAGRRENVFTHRIGPLPMWAWVAIVGGVLVAWRIWSGKSTAAQSQTTSGTDTTGTGSAQVPYFINQVYTGNGPPAAPSSATAAPPASAPAPVTGITNPAPTGTSTQPKPTTTLNQWAYPAPSGLQSYDLAKSGTRLSWNAVTGPGGQHPNSYTVATYNARGQLVDQFDTTAGNTNTAEYGRGGKGLPSGTYHSNVWANGGPVAPPHASVQYTLKG